MSTDSAPCARQLPRVATVGLGVAGLGPFLATLAAAFLAPPPGQALAIEAFLAYGSVILSFLGGVHWGLALVGAGGSEPAGRRLVVGVLPSLIAWPALLLDPPATAAMLLTGFVALRLYEAGPGAAGLPSDYRRLRTRLTAVVAACHLALIARLLLLA
ncbi:MULTISPECIES: DUF3429 domain-containing protein [Halomonas]|uniref:DUF3429 domain-containing protein n=1 Tax=Halomonas halophila TaxID=29573 RepID=A0ABQ0U704_9GAMM|nr:MULTISPECIES: DUF3429 domain-containing protein [Halomonas]MDR5890091.1 DUF3429 domain-containing protein [Halomonas salina]WJY06648.1 DUF3429 domain-containing protein [Halomonas halophila]GEK74296.1 hypothetical protein HHA04nite_28400 [Halomonas halophila]